MTTGSQSGKMKVFKDYLPAAIVVISLIGGMFFVNHEMTAFKKDILTDNMTMLKAHNDSATSHPDLRDATKVLLELRESDRNMIIEEIRKLNR